MSEEAAHDEAMDKMVASLRARYSGALSCLATEVSSKLKALQVATLAEMDGQPLLDPRVVANYDDYLNGILQDIKIIEANGPMDRVGVG